MNNKTYYTNLIHIIRWRTKKIENAKLFEIIEPNSTSIDNVFSFLEATQLDKQIHKIKNVIKKITYFIVKLLF